MAQEPIPPRRKGGKWGAPLRSPLAKHPVSIKTLKVLMPAPLPKPDTLRVVLPILDQHDTPSLPLPRELPRHVTSRSEDFCLSPEEQYVAFAALATMIDDVHAVQDQMSDGQWALAESLYRRLTRTVERREKKK